MKKIIFLIISNLLALSAFTQFIHKIKADSVLITNDSCTAELNLENSTKNVTNSFLFNKGNGRTEFRKVVVQIDSVTYLIGGDTVRTGGGSASIFAMDGLIKSGNNLYLGNTSPGSGSHNFTANRHQYLNGNYYSIGGTANDVDSFPVFRFYSNGDFTSKTTNQYITPSPYKNGIRFNARMGYLEIGLSTRVDTTISNKFSNIETAAIILNTDSRGNIAGQLINSFIGAYNVQLPVGQRIYSSMITGGSYFLGGSLAHVVGGGVYHTIGGSVNGSLIIGNSQWINKNDDNSGWFGFNNRNANGRTYGNITGGWVNNIGASAQLTVGNYLTNKSHAATALGNANVDFLTLPYNAYDSVFINNTQNIEPKALLFSIGNSNSKNGSTKSNAISTLYNGRTQINTTGFSNNLVEADVTPKAALEVVSNNSGVLLPKLTTTQRNSIANPDLHNGLLLYNTDSSAFQYYNGSIWKSMSNENGIGIGSGWNLTGNTGTSSSTNFIGTTDAAPLVFKSNNVNVALMNQFGNVGIGTSAPTERLHLYGANPTLFIEGDVNSYYPGIVIKNVFGQGRIDNYGINGINGTYIIQQTANNKPVASGVTPTGAVSISEDSSMVTQRVISARNQVNDIFRVSRNIHTTPGAVAERQFFNVDKDGIVGVGSIAQTGQAVINLKQSTNLSNGWNLGYTSFNSNDLYTYGYENAAYRLFTNTTERFTVTGAGNVGIGITAPAYLLDVNGDARINTLPFLANRDTVLTYDPATKQLKVTKITSGGSGWGLSGNATTNSGINFLGTTDNVSLRLRTNNIQRAVIDSNGRMGVNTAAPAYQLDVNGDARISTLPFVANRDTVLTYNASTKQVSATKLNVPQRTVMATNFTNATTGYLPVTGLSFTAEANKTYSFRFFIVYTSPATTTGSRWSVTAPSISFLNYRSEYSLTATTRTINEGLSAINVPATANATSSSTTSNIAVIEGVTRLTATGLVSATMASEVATSTITALGGRCYVVYEVIAN